LIALRDEGIYKERGLSDKRGWGIRPDRGNKVQRDWLYRKQNSSVKKAKEESTEKPVE